MRWINTLERRFGSLAIPGLIRIVVALNALVFLLLLSKPELADALALRPERVLRGEVWRLVSYLFIPNYSPRSGLNVFFVVLYLNALWVMGDGLEQAWGSFKLNLFYLLGMLGTTAAALLFDAGDTTGFYLNASLLFAFATLFPDFPFLIYYILPVAVKWIALFSLALIGLRLLHGETATRLTILVSLANYILFFGPEWVRIARAQGRTAVRRQRFQLARHEEGDEALHHCRVCGASELTAPDKEFRVSADGEEYCLEHLPVRQRD